MARHAKSWNAVSLVAMAAQATQLNICPAIVFMLPQSTVENLHKHRPKESQLQDEGLAFPHSSCFDFDLIDVKKQDKNGKWRGHLRAVYHCFKAFCAPPIDYLN
jgi:hypothetical protein